MYVHLWLLIAGVEIHWQNQDLLKISPVHKEDIGIGGHAQYEVSSVLCYLIAFNEHRKWRFS